MTHIFHPFQHTPGLEPHLFLIVPSLGSSSSYIVRTSCLQAGARQVPATSKYRELCSLPLHHRPPILYQPETLTCTESMASASLSGLSSKEAPGFLIHEVSSFWNGVVGGVVRGTW